MDRASAYAAAVVSGEITACKALRAVAARHLEEATLARAAGHVRGWTYRPEIAEAAIDDFERLRLEEQRLRLFGWQQFAVGLLYGWVGVESGYRRFRKVFCLSAKGSGKTPLFAAVTLRSTFAEGERRAQGLFIAHDTDQARMPMKDAGYFVRDSPGLSACRVMGGTRLTSIEHERSRSQIRVVSNDKKGLGKAGHRVHVLFGDEAQQWVSFVAFKEAWANVKFRQQPIQILACNSGVGRSIPCYQEYSHARDVAIGKVQDDRYLPLIFEFDPEDPQDFAGACAARHLWVKANPALSRWGRKPPPPRRDGRPVPEDEDRLPGYHYIDSRIAEAVTPADQAEVLRLQFCIWTTAVAPLFTEEQWRAIVVPDLDAAIGDGVLADCRCFLGLDLSSRTDLTALAIVWLLPDGTEVTGPDGAVLTPTLAARVLAWLPRGRVAALERADEAPFSRWEAEGLIRFVPGDTLDYDDVAFDVAGDVIPNNCVEEVAFDPHRMRDFRRALARCGVATFMRGEKTGRGIMLSPHDQGTRYTERSLWMPGSLEAFEAAVAGSDLIVEQSELVEWAVLGAEADVANSRGDRVLSKNLSQTFIDPAVALVMGTGAAVAGMDSAPANPLEDFLRLTADDPVEPVDPW